MLRDNKGVNLPGIELRLNAMSDDQLQTLKDEVLAGDPDKRALYGQSDPRSSRPLRAELWALVKQRQHEDPQEAASGA